MIFESFWFLINKSNKWLKCKYVTKWCMLYEYKIPSKPLEYQNLYNEQWDYFLHPSHFPNLTPNIHQVIIVCRLWVYMIFQNYPLKALILIQTRRSSKDTKKLYGVTWQIEKIETKTSGSLFHFMPKWWQNYEWW